jgi:structural hemagglutinin/hemolysin toxin protein RtxA
MYKLCFYVPDSHLEAVKTAVFAAGAARIGDYDSCCWQVPGQGQFRPLDGSKPFLGQQGEVEVVAEYRVEMVCEEAFVRAAVVALIEAHPYETPAWDVVALITELPEE